MEVGGYTKDLSAIHPDLSSICILDNSPGAYRKFPRKCFKSLRFLELSGVFRRDLKKYPDLCSEDQKYC